VLAEKIPEAKEVISLPSWGSEMSELSEFSELSERSDFSERSDGANEATLAN